MIPGLTFGMVGVVVFRVLFWRAVWRLVLGRGHHRLHEGDARDGDPPPPWQM